VAAQWFGIPVTSPTHVGDDGRTLKGSLTLTSAGETAVSEWDLTAEREE
jgi:hypothetical protein